MTVAIHSDIEFYAIIGKAVSRAIDEVIERVFTELQDEIRRDIYGAYTPQDYDRTEGLLEAWKHEASGLSGNIEFQPSMLESDKEGFHYNSPYGWDVREEIFGILEGGYKAYNAKTGKRAIPPRPMWEDFLAKIDSKINRWIIIALRRQGLVLEEVQWISS